jgi:hypothetical protein
LVLVAFVVIAGFPPEAGAQTTDLFTCIERGGPIPYCNSARTGGLTNLDCNRNYAFYRGRVAWYPLRCVGPVTIEVNAAAHVQNRYPLYIEIVPSGSSPCLDPGYVVMIARGRFDCDPWESIGPIDITRFVPLGSSYTLQVVFFHTVDGFLESPGLDCIRLTAHPVLSALSQSTWARVKRLYQ